MESTPTSFWTNDEPTAIRPLITEDCEEVLTKALWSPIITSVVADSNSHFLDKASIKEVQRTFVMLIAHVVYVHAKRPFYCLGNKFDVLIFFNKRFDRP